MTALLEVSEATTPSMIPVPYFSGCLEVFLAVIQERIPAVEPPMPGRIPMPVPMRAERSAFHFCPTNSFQVNPKPLILKLCLI